MADQDYRVFISYSWQTKTIVNRIYFDLIRSGVTVWKDDKSQEKGEEIWPSIEISIKSSTVFLLMDSASARKSAWVKRECALARALERNGQIDIRVCLVDHRANTLNHPELFEHQNDILYYDFSRILDYDNSGVYHASIHELCQFLKVKFSPWTSVPREQDLEKEIFFDPTLHTTEAERILRDYELFRDRFRMGYQSALSRLQNIISDCEHLGIKLISTGLALGVIYVHQHKLDLAEQAFLKITQDYPRDPRGFIGLAGTLGIRGKSVAAIAQYSIAIQLIRESGNLNYTRHLPEIQLCLAEIYVQHGNYDKAEELLDNLPAPTRLLPEAQTVQACIRMYRDHHPEALNILETLLNNIEGIKDEKPDHYLYLLEAYRLFDPHNKSREIRMIQRGVVRFPENMDLQVALAQSTAASGSFEPAIYLYEKIIAQSGDSIKYKIEAATVCHYIAQQQAAYNQDSKASFYANKKKEYLEPCLEVIPSTAEEYYLIGQAYYLLGNMERAAELYLSYQHLASGIERFPYYKAFIESGI